MNTEKQAIIYMHIATFLFGMTAIIGKLIQLNEFNMVWHRMLITTVVFMLFPPFWKAYRNTPKPKLRIFFFNGFLIALHWLTFYGSIKVNNNASLTLICFGSVSLFTAILEPIMTKTSFKKSQFLLGFAVLVGLVFIALGNPSGDYSLQSNYIKAINLALASSLLAVLFTIFNKKHIGNTNPLVATWAQMLGGFVLLSILLPFVFAVDIPFVWNPSSIDWFWLILLSVVCTNLAFSLEVQSLKRISAFTSSLILNLEPVYGIIVAIIVFQENKLFNTWFYMGTTIIIASVFLHGFLKKRT